MQKYLAQKNLMSVWNNYKQ